MQHRLLDFISKYMTLTEQEKELIISCDIFRSVSKGTLLLRQGQYSQQGFFVLKGILRTYYEIDGEEKTTAFYSELEGLLPVCVTNQQPSEYFVETVEDSIISVSNPKMESIIFSQFPRFETLCRILGEELL
ncbi:Crp/Fnr family transcriptional regulator [Algoriphagus confluentis]|uniref:Cyclic nucleotide-binding domain-containing protein n=1 Tax=Algoriphagus confluentis TaxID=1697556 RepID=A0ABQ6PVD5_9BACT|nr:hypothetical protein Aconfl_41720 [Algoriphagus confluentis]